MYLFLPLLKISQCDGFYTSLYFVYIYGLRVGTGNTSERARSLQLWDQRYRNPVPWLYLSRFQPPALLTDEVSHKFRCERGALLADKARN
jgi:hypothetical protein